MRTHPLRRALIVWLLGSCWIFASVPIPARAQARYYQSSVITGLSAQAVLSGNIVPLSVRLRDLNSSWREFEVGAADQGTSAVGAYMSVLSGGQARADEYFTSGQTVAMGNAIYLVAYRLPSKQIDPASLLGQHPSPGAMLPQLVSLNSPLTLTLLNLGTVGAIDNIRPFDLGSLISNSNSQRARMGSAVGDVAAPDLASQQRLRSLSQAVLRFAHLHAGVIPQLTPLGSLKRQVGPYVSDETVYQSSQTGRAYLANPKLSGHKLSEYALPSTFVLFYEDAPGADGLRVVAFLDGSVQMLGREDWLDMQQRQRLP